MAKVTTKTADVVFVLELNEAEAQYVEAALLAANPAHLRDEDGDIDDVVWNALHTAMLEAGVERDFTALA